MKLEDNRNDAILSDDRDYRYRLTRKWDADKPTAAWIMLNPSTADEDEDDPTIRRCINFAKDWGYGSILVGNLFALRATDPDEVERQANPIGEQNDSHLQGIARNAEKVVAAWGATYDMGLGAVRRPYVTTLLKKETGTVYALDTTKDGHPAHPLYQPSDKTLSVYASKSEGSDGSH